MSDASNGCRRKTHAWLLAGLALLAFVAHGASLAGEFVFDDVHSVAGNPALQAPIDWWRLASDPSAFSAGSSRMFRPVLLLSFGANAAISMEPWCFKLTNVCLHALVTMLAFSWLRRLAVGRAAAATVAALFAAHPLQSEAVNLVSARSELLLVLGLLVSLRSHLELRHHGRQLLACLGIVLGTVLACGSKETGVVVPALLFAQGWLLRRERWGMAQWGRAVRSVLPALALVVAYLVLRKLLLGQVTVSVFGRIGEDPTSGHGRTLQCQLATMGLLLPRALLQMFVPTGLSVDPAVSFRHGFWDPLVLAGWGGVLGVTVAAAWPGRRASVRRIGVLLAWGTALPWIVIPLNMPLAEHRLYGPVLGVAVIASTWLPRLHRRLSQLQPRLPRCTLSAVLLLWSMVATNRSLDYRDERVLWQVELAARATSFRAHWGLGTARLRAFDIEGAIGPIARAHELNPAHFDVLRNYAEALIRLPEAAARPFEAIAVASELLRRSPRDPWARTLLAEAMLQAGRATGDLERLREAERLALSCLEVAAPKGLVYRMAAAARRATGDQTGALQFIDVGLQRGLDPVGLRLERASLLRELGRHREAQRELLRAQQLAPMDPAVQHALRQFAKPGR